jgi:lipoyl(octanoyl) transferase
MRVTLRPSPAKVLSVYLLGSVPLDDVLTWQRRLVYDVGGERAGGVLVLCEHPPMLSIGRHGSRAQVLADTELAWPRRWVNRGGGVVYHGPGQLAVYALLPLDAWGLTVVEYVDALHEVIQMALATLHLPTQRRPDAVGVWAQERLLAPVGIAVRDWVTSFGCVLNVCPNLDVYRPLRWSTEPTMTSVQRELRTPVRIPAVRAPFVEAFAQRFAFTRTAVFHHHPALATRPLTHAFTARTG